MATRFFINILHGDDSDLCYYKPVASGCDRSDWGYRSPDEVEVIENTPLTDEHVRSTLRFDAPLSPDQAAQREDRAIKLDDVLEEWEEIRRQYSRVVVEGIGGVAVPFNLDEDVADLASEMSLPVVMVVQSTLGTISYTRTAVEFLRRRGNNIRGILLTPEEGRDIERINKDHLSTLFPSVNIELLPFITDNKRVDEAMERCQLFLEDSGLL